MAELTAKEKLQPSLLDRLTDDEVDNTHESRDKRVLSMRSLRRAVLRDLGWLFNSFALSSFQNMDKFPLAAQSVINYGFPDLSGKTASGLDLSEVEQRLRQAIWDFEPRILRDTVQVNASALGKGDGNHNQIVFEIHGELWGQPLPERLYLKTEMDLEMGEIRVYDNDARSN